MAEPSLRETGQTLWVQVKNELFDEIVNGPFQPGDRLPAEGELVGRFGVSRQTVRRAMAELVDLGLVRVEQGRGAFVHGPVVHFRLSKKVVHSENLLKQGHMSTSHFIAFEEAAASHETAEGLDLPVGATVYAIQTVSFADRVPIATSWNYLPKARFPDLKVRKTRSASMTALYAKQGIDDYIRLKTVVSARPASKSEARLLQQPASRWVLVTKKTDADLEGLPICYGEACWVTDRVQFVIDPRAF